MKAMLKIVPIGELHPCPSNPFAVREDVELQDSIREFGVMSPIMVRPLDGGGYEIISGHRRKAAAELAGMDKVPVYICDLDDTDAIIALVDSNLHREHILPSEKAYAYKMKLDAMKHQGIACGHDVHKAADTDGGQPVHKSRDEISKTECGRQVQRYIRLTELVPEILQMVDEGKIALSPAVELSHLPKKEQADLLETIQSEDRTPNLSQCQRMRKLSAEGRLDMDGIFNIMTEEKANQKEQVKFKADDLCQFFPKNTDVKKMEQTIVKLLEEWQRKRERQRDQRDAR